MEENDLEAKGFQIDDITWLKSKDKSLGRSASLWIWLDSAEAAEWIINNGLVFKQRYIGSIEPCQIKTKRCHRCQGFGHLAWSCKERMRCGHWTGEHDRRECPPAQQQDALTAMGHTQQATRNAEPPPYPTAPNECRITPNAAAKHHEI